MSLDNVDSWRGPTASQAAGLTLAAALRMIAAAATEARALRVAMSVAVVDSGGQLVAFERMDGAITALKTGNGSVKGLLDPNWDAEGLSGADLARHMAKYELEFAPVPRGEEETYETVYKSLAAYLFVLTQPSKK